MVIDRGQAIARGTADELKDLLGGARAEIDLAGASTLASVVSALGELVNAGAEPTGTHASASVPLRQGTTTPQVVRALDAAGVEVGEVSVARPTLDDVFLTLTGHAAEEVGTDDDEGVAA